MHLHRINGQVLSTLLVCLEVLILLPDIIISILAMSFKQGAHVTDMCSKSCVVLKGLEIVRLFSSLGMTQ